MRAWILIIVFGSFYLIKIFGWSERETLENPIKSIRVASFSRASSLVHKHHNSIRGTLIVPKRVKALVLNRQVNNQRYLPQRYILPGERGVRCSRCEHLNSKCQSGDFFAYWAAEEIVSLDKGQKKRQSALVDAFSSSMLYLKARSMIPAYATMIFECRFDELVDSRDWGTLQFEMDRMYDIKEEMQFFYRPKVSNTKFGPNETQYVQLAMHPDVALSPKPTSPVVCGRQLLNDVNASAIVEFVQHNLRNGIGTTVMYRMGNEYIMNEGLLEEFLENKSLVIIDLTNELERIYGSAYPLVTTNSKAASQWLARYDCFFRTHSAKPVWVLFLDMDERITGLGNSSARDFLARIKPNVHALVLRAFRSDTNLCNSVVHETNLSKLLKRRVSPPKPAIRWNATSFGWRIHGFSKIKLHKSQIFTVPPKFLFLDHNRCLNNIRDKK